MQPVPPYKTGNVPIILLAIILESPEPLPIKEPCILLAYIEPFTFNELVAEDQVRLVDVITGLRSLPIITCPNGKKLQPVPP